MTSPLEPADTSEAQAMQPQADNLSFHSVFSSEKGSLVNHKNGTLQSPAPITSPYQGTVDSIRQRPLATRTPGSIDANSWTYLVNLTATMLPMSGGGSGHKYDQLKNLKDLTKATNSEVIVQEYDDQTGMLRRYEIAHGQINEFEPTKSFGTAKDLQNLVAMAPAEGHIGLINEAHGNGALGFHGDAGAFSIENFQTAVQNGLAATGRTSLDVLSIDSCLMGNVNFLSSVSSLSKNIVASELEEFSSIELSASPPRTIYDMQPEDAYLAAMLKHPPADGKEAAKTIFDISSKTCDSQSPPNNACGTPTLAIYDSQAAPQAELALDKFGEALQQAIKEPSARSAVDALISKFPDLSQSGDHLRDVDSFAQGIVRLIDSGELSDPHRQLRDAANSSIAADKALVKGAYLNTNSLWAQIVGTQNLHGLNVFLPGANFDIRKEAENMVDNGDAQTMPLNELLDKEIASALPNDSNGGWANFVRSLRSPSMGTQISLSP